METIQQFAQRYRLKVRKDECGDPIILGGRKQGTDHHIYDNGDGRLGVCLMFGEHPAKWTYAKQKGLSAGLIVRQDGSGEGTMLFDPQESNQARMAMRLTGARIKRTLTPEQAQALTERLVTARQAKECVPA
jgi:hypothetical protein